MTTTRFVPNPGMYDELARSDDMRDLLLEVAGRGAAITRATAPSYSGPTWDPSVNRSGEYRAQVYSAVSMSPSGWRGEFGSNAPWTVQVEFGTGGGRSRRDTRGRFRRLTPRPQGGHSPKTRTLGRALDALRSS